MTDFRKFPSVEVKTESAVEVGWEKIGARIAGSVSRIKRRKKIVVVELYPGVFEDEIVERLSETLSPDLLILSRDLFHSEEVVKQIVHPDVTDNRIFGYMTRLQIKSFLENENVAAAAKSIANLNNGVVLIVGTGASEIYPDRDLLVYADMARWEIQLRMREHYVNNLGMHNKDTDDWMLLYKQGYFVDWRVCDRLKKQLMLKPDGTCGWDFLLDTNDRDEPKLVEGKVVIEGLRECLNRPFSVVPFFDPGPWGGQWMKKVCGLDESAENYAWCFNCVPEENSLLLKINGVTIEIPAIDLVFFDPGKLLGDAVHARFGEEFPIRFDYLDTIEGGNLSLQVHPLTEYIQEKFGVHYTQDESYYIMDASEDAVVYLGLKENIDRAKMMDELERAQEGEATFDAEKFVQTWPVKKHDHLLVPAGTVHCSGKGNLVLEISATPYIFTFKLWDWGRLGLDGRPRPINLEHGRKVIRWERTTSWTKANLVNRVERVGEGDGWVEERTGLHEREFIETRRHWFTKKVPHNTDGGVNVLNLVEGSSVVVESPSGSFKPFVVHYAETFIVPASVGPYSIRPFGKSEGKRCGTIKAFVRTKA